MTLILKIDEATPSLNVTVRRHWSANHRLRTHWGWLVRIAHLPVRTAPWGADAVLRGQVTIERYGRRELDYDNFVGGCKPLIDGLVAEGILTDDSPEHVSVTYLQHRAVDGKEQTVVTVTGQVP